MKTLSDKRNHYMRIGKENYYYDEEDVKEFIKDLKEGLGDLKYMDETMDSLEYNDLVLGLIDKLAGDTLI